MTACPKCGTTVEQNAVGRRKVYCGSACRRAAEFELRRLQRHLEAAERAVHSVEADMHSGRLAPATHEKRLAFANQHRDALEARLRTLVADDDVKGGRHVNDDMTVGTVGVSARRSKGRRHVDFLAEEGMALGGAHHFALLNHPAVYDQLRRWLSA